MKHHPSRAHLGLLAQLSTWNIILSQTLEFLINCRVCQLEAAEKVFKQC